MVDVTKDTNRPVKAVQIAIGTGSNTLSVKTETPPAPEQQKEKCEIPANFVAPPTSKGEKWYNWLVYRGMNYWINLAGSILIADYFKNLGGKPKLEWTAKKIAPLFKNMGAKEKALSYAEGTLTYAALTSGGWILLAPLKYLEDRKRPIVHWLNKKLGVNQTALDGHELTPDEIYIEKEQPKHSWLKVIGRRALGSFCVLASGNILDYTFRRGDKKGTDVVTNFIMGGSDGQGGVNRILNFKYGFLHLPGGKFLAANPRTQAWLNFAALDSFFTEITASVMWLTKGAKKQKMPQEVASVSPAGQYAQALESEVAPATGTINPNDFKKTPDKEALAKTARLSHAEKIAAESNPSLQPSL